ncbi:MAG: hypothetical protein ACJAYS_001161 [Lentimonas sp.]|jgi:hypothetical protein
MGIIDKTIYKFECPKCKTTETVRILDHGSEWSGSYWQEGPPLKNFDVTWHGEGKEEPSIKEKRCKQCGSIPTVKPIYS